ncbi:outer membrane protein W [Buttiauxella ferragutiae ATCC 51602]|jgi:outer membrane protein|uniref:Outer membrane protein W n=1 Tax=Buttiauxella ferragutiae ATCC 51602 TaxID=1354252 RepID=A0ABX2W627_9ENTR|nr:MULTISPECIES: outer membrane protein OmpW [Buttiauxella]AYN26196.1 outer membrane protein OmpW [Buttiauxella sp. 3AFRM03]MCE0824507.1 outer membrane protein OmpW [Buttiauxella ferragutiae]OAT26351.1 outer membrane protein W [Buttiauxella ferragutiae ATCC 51602]TDN54464.1 outer membrane protein [Buttiauxella sp. JUb87]UNK63505.1 outer membrane protein OmpW [Buttiauxella ferragutiae]
MKKLSVALLALTCLSGEALAHQQGEFFMRAGSATVRPTEGSDNVLGMGGFSVSNNTQLGLTFDYMVTDNIGIELLAATPFRHHVGLGPTGDIATVSQLPPTLMAQWYFGNAQSKVRPYVGVGINYTTFFDADFNQTGKDAGLSDLSVKDSWGVAGQVGLDYMINENWLLNMSVWYMDIDTEVKFKAGGEQQNINTRIDPWVFMFSAGYRF